MVSKIAIRKNKIDLQYKKYLQEYAAILGIIGALAVAIYTTTPNINIIGKLILIAMATTFIYVKFADYGVLPKLENLENELSQLEKEAPD